MAINKPIEVLINLENNLVKDIFKKAKKNVSDYLIKWINKIHPEIFYDKNGIPIEFIKKNDILKKLEDINER